MLTYIIAGIITFVFTTILTIAGVGAAGILIPIFFSLGDSASYCYVDCAPPQFNCHDLCINELCKGKANSF